MIEQNPFAKGSLEHYIWRELVRLNAGSCGVEPARDILKALLKVTLAWVEYNVWENWKK